ncbi:MAG: phosphatidate cytidylyltransferase [Cellulosilyticaceae bacterium]
MFTRVLTGVLGIPIVILIMVLGSPVIEIAGLAIALIGVYELYQMVQKKYKVIPWVGYGSVALYFVGLEFFTKHFLFYITALIMLLLILMVFNHPKYGIADIAMTFIAPIYVAVLLSFIMLIRRMPAGEFLVWFVFISAWGSDTCAYFAGKCFGKHKLAPVLSPKKTIEGSVGGAIGATLIAALYSFIYSYFVPSVEVKAIGFLLVLVFIASLLSMVGDLAASAIKRNIGEKDFGHLFPGHGGVLDRFDSILLVAPFLYFALTFLG